MVYIMIQMWLYDSDKKERKEERKDCCKPFDGGWEIYTGTKAS